MDMLRKFGRPQKFFDVALKDGMADKQCGTHAKMLDDGALAILTGDDEVVAAYAAGEWRSLSSRFVPEAVIVPANHTVFGVGGHPLQPMSDAELGRAFSEVMGEG